MKKYKILAVLIVVILVAVFLKDNNSRDGRDYIKIGWQGPLSGQAASLGEVIKTATQIAVDEINANGGIQGKKIEMVFDDDQCTAQGAINATKKQIEIDKVDLSIAGACTPSALAGAQLFEESKIPQIVYCAASPAIKDSGDYIFRINPSDKIMAQRMAEYIVNDLGKKKVAVLYINNDWGVTLRDDVDSELKKLGAEVVLSEAHSQEGNVDMKTSISKIAQTNPEVLVFASYPTGIILGMKQIEDFKLNAIILGAGASWDSKSTWEKIGPVTRDARFFAPKVVDKETLLAKMKEKTGRDDMFSCAYYSYDAVKMVANALSDTKNFDSESIKESLYKSVFAKSISQPTIKFDSDGELVDPQYEVKKWDGSKITN